MLTIAELAERSGVSRRNIHFYIQQGILPPPDGAGLGAYYSEEHLRRLQALPILRARGMRLDGIRTYLGNASRRDLEKLVAPTSAPAPIDVVKFAPARQGIPHVDAVLRLRLAPGVEVLADAALVEKHPELFERLQEVTRETLSNKLKKGNRA